MNNKRFFSCSQEFLYIIALLAWALCRRYLNDFKNFKALYNDQFVDDAIIAVNNAEAIANQHQRNLIVQQQREKLNDEAKTLFGMFQSLKRYIRTSYPRKQQKEQQLLAGAGLYEAAHTGTLGNLRDFLKAASGYITQKSSKLQANNNMPADFPDQFNTLSADCISLINYQVSAENNRKTNTGDKATADNDIFESMMVMLQDGQDIFKNDKTIKRQFVFNSLLRLARGSHPARLKGYVYDSVTGKGLQNVVVRTVTGGYISTTSKTGRYDIARIAGGETYTVLVEVEGYEPFQQEVTLKPGISRTITFKLVAVADQAMQDAA